MKILAANILCASDGAMNGDGSSREANHLPGSISLVSPRVYCMSGQLCAFQCDSNIALNIFIN